jgi:hypothetical protein
VATLHTGILEMPPSKLALETGFPNDVFRRVHKIEKREYYFRLSICLSVCPHETTRLPLEGFFMEFVI